MKRIFTYPNYGTPDTHPDYTAHSGQTVEILRQLTDEECDPECQPMYFIRADDGWEGHAHVSELGHLICARTACDTKLKDFVRIWNNPGEVIPFRDYCVPDGRKILVFALAKGVEHPLEHQLHTKDGIKYWKLYAKKQ